MNYYNGIVIKAPRDHLKTFCFSEMLALRECKLNPGVKINLYSKSDKLAGKILRRIKNYANYPYFRDILQGANVDNKMELVFGNRSEINAGGYWTGVRGEHPDIIIMDDVIDSQVIYSDEQNLKAKERFASEILPTAEPDTRIIIVGTLQRDDDLYSMEFEGEDESDRHWINKTYDAIIDEEKHLTLYPEKWSWQALMNRKKQIIDMGIGGSKWFDKEYRNMATNLIGEIIKPEWKKTYRELPKGLTTITGWDLSTGKKLDEGDWTAKAHLGYRMVNGLPEIYIIDAYRARLNFGERVKALVSHGERDKPGKIKVEDNVFQADTVQTAKRNSTLNIEGVHTGQNKLEKYNQVLVPLFEMGRIYFKEGDKAQEAMWQEICSLPRGAHDDQADALCIALKNLPFVMKARDYIIVG